MTDGPIFNFFLMMSNWNGLVFMESQDFFFQFQLDEYSRTDYPTPRRSLLGPAFFFAFPAPVQNADPLPLVSPRSLHHERGPLSRPTNQIKSAWRLREAEPKRGPPPSTGEGGDKTSPRA